jgi:Ca2+-binding RTX toxin-like protein
MGVAKADLSEADFTGLVASQGDGNDVVEGSGLAETIEGLGGNDILIGAGDDVWLGGHEGDDVVDGDSGDTITDFATSGALDNLDLSTMLTNLGYAGSDAFADGYIALTQSGADTLVQVDVDGGANSLQTLVTLQSVNAGDIDTGVWIV